MVKQVTDDWRERLRAPVMNVIAWALDNPARMLRTSTESGKLRVYAWERDTGRQTALPPVAKPGYTWLSPDGKTIYYIEDTNDSEIGHLIRLPWGGETGEPVAPELPPMYYYGMQIGRDGTLYFAGSGQGSYRIYRMDEGGANILYEHRNEAYLPFLSADESLLAFSTSEPANNRHWQATVVDARTGEPVSRLSDGDEYSVNPAFFLMSAADVRPWSPISGDQRLLVTSNISDEKKPAIWNVATGDRTNIAGELPGEVVPFGWMPDAAAILLRQAHNGRTYLYRYDIASGRTEQLPHAAGTLSPLPVFPDGSIWYSFTSMAEPFQTRALENGQERVIIPPTMHGFKQRWEPISYPSSDGTEIHGFIGIPDGEGPFPVILNMHGGPTGQITDMYVAGWQHIVEEGYLFCTINFRGSTGYGRAFQEQINGNPGAWELEDMAAARQYLIERGLARPDRIMLYGGSYGGYLTLMGLTRQLELWAAGFALVPLCNFELMYEDANQRLRGWAQMLLGGSPEERPGHYRSCSPIAQVERLRAPVAIIAHRSDTRCPIRQVEEFIAHLERQGISYEATISEGGHGTRNVDEAIKHHEMLLDFAKRKLKV